MVDKIFYPQPIIPVKKTGDGAKNQKPVQPGQSSFKDLLNSQLSSKEIKFSAHAQQRLADRNIQLTKAELDKLGNAVEKAAQKGSRDSLIMMNNLAFVVSVKNKTVVTAVDEASMKEHVFTNIDSAVMV